MRRKPPTTGTTPNMRKPRPQIRRVAVLGAELALLLLAVMFCLGSARPAAAVPRDTGAPNSATTLVLQGAAKEEVGALEAEAARVQAEIDALDHQVERLTEKYNEIRARLDQINAQLLDLRRQQEVALQKHRMQTEAINQRLVATYKSGREGVIEILLATEDFRDFVTRLVLIAKIALHDQQLADGLHEAERELAAIEAAIRGKKTDELELRGLLEQQRAEVETALQERQEALAGINSSIAAVIEEERLRQEEERRRLEAEIRARFPNTYAYTGPLPQVPDAVLNQLIETAAAYLGIPYLWAGEKPSTGMDCSGFVMYVFRQHGIELPHFAAWQCDMGVPVDLVDIQPGDVVGFGASIHHIGIYIGDGLFIHAPRTGDVIRVARLADRNDITAVRRFPIQPRVGPPAFD